MTIYTKEFLEKIKSGSNLAEIVSFCLGLETVGRSFLCECPFCIKKVGSERDFVVSKIGKQYHCFKCGVHGDVFSFLMNFLNISLDSTIEFLAKKYKIPFAYADKDETFKNDSLPLHKNFIEESFSEEDKCKQKEIVEKLKSGKYSEEQELVFVREYDAINKKY